MISESLCLPEFSASPELNLVSFYGALGRPQVWASEWVGVVCHCPSRLMVALPSESGRTAGRGGPGAFTVNLSSVEQEFYEDALPLLMGDVPEGLAERGMHWGCARLVRAPRLLEASTVIECRTLSVRNRFRQTVLTAEVLGIHIDGVFSSGDRCLNLCNFNPFSRPPSRGAETRQSLHLHCR